MVVVMEANAGLANTIRKQRGGKNLLHAKM
jgi:hypothetical protein